VVYHGRRGERVPDNVTTHVKIHSSVKAIRNVAFFSCTQMVDVILNDRLKMIRERSFDSCRSLVHINIPHTVNTIKKGVFSFCGRLTTVTLGNGLEEIGEHAFGHCRLLERIILPPPVVRTIDIHTFHGCVRMKNIKFCDKFEKFASCEVMRNWWNPTMTNWDRQLDEVTLRTYSFLVQCRIPERLSGLAQMTRWHDNIHDMLRWIPTRFAVTRDSNDYFDSIEFKLTLYEYLLKEGSTLFPDQFVLDGGVVRNILSFL
jgi:hypothetical protein